MSVTVGSQYSEPTTIEHPSGWATVRLGAFLSRIEAGNSFRCDSAVPSADQVGVIKISAVTWGTYRENESKVCEDPSKVNPDLFIRPGDFLFSRANTIELVGACVIAGNVTKRIMLSDKILRFHFSAPVQKWVLYFLRSMAGRTEIQKYATGNQESMRNIGQERIRSIELPVAPLPEQHRIVAEIEKQFTRLDDAVATLERVQASLKRARASVLKAAVEGRLVPTEAELARAEGRTYEPASVLLERILAERKRKHEETNGKKKYKPPVDPETQGLPHLPEGWAWASTEQVVAVQPGGPIEQGWSPKCEGVPATATEWGVIKTTAVQAMQFIDSENKRLPSNLQPRTACEIHNGDLIITRAGPRKRAGVACLVRSTRPGLMLCDKVYRVRAAQGIVPQYIELVLNAPPILDLLEGLKTGISDSGVNLTQSGFLRMSLPVPPLAEQHRITAEVERRLSVLDALDHTIRQNLSRCAHLRQSILKRAFSGKLVPQDPNDEPASALLERIHAQSASR